jgi:hypothetical protein
MTLQLIAILSAVFLTVSALADGAGSLRADLLAATTKHLNALLGPDSKVVALKGKSSAADTAQAYFLAYELTGEQKYRAAAVQVADGILKDMRATKFGVLYIKEKENPAGEKVAGGGPPAFGWYTATLSYIYRREGGRDADLKYVAGVLDAFPWNEQGWWSADIDVNTGVSKQPLSKPSPVNKNASLVLAAAVAAESIKEIDPALSARLKHKADQCLYKQIIPAQQPDGFWHYGLTGNDPGNKDVIGYFMVTMNALVQLRQLATGYDDPALTAAVAKASTFAHTCIAPMTEPNTGPPCARRTGSTPTRYLMPRDLKRAFALALILVNNGDADEAARILGHAMPHFPYGNPGEDGAHAAAPSAIMSRLLARAVTP